MKKLTALVITAIFTLVFGIQAFADTYVPRLTEPLTSDTHYYSNTNPYYRTGFGIPNCVAYAWGRVYELNNSVPSLFYGNADFWYGYTADGYLRGQVPQVGAVACWDGGDGVGVDGNPGHVAIIEAVNGNSVTISESAYLSFNFRVRTITNITDTRGWQGFIYATAPMSEIPDTCSTDYMGIYKTTAAVNLRAGHGTSYPSLGIVPAGTSLIVDKADGTWAHVTYNGTEGLISLAYLELEEPVIKPPTPPPPPPASTAGLYCVDTALLNIRSAPSSDSSIVGTVTRGELIRVVGKTDGWLIIEHGGSKIASALEIVSGSRPTAYVSSDYAHLVVREDILAKIIV
jgi:surface antigen